MARTKAVQAYRTPNLSLQREHLAHGFRCGVLHSRAALVLATPVAAKEIAHRCNRTLSDFNPTKGGKGKSYRNGAPDDPERGGHLVLTHRHYRIKEGKGEEE